MRITNKVEYIEKYLDGKLKDGDLWEFKINLKKDKELVRELKFQEELRDTLKDRQKMKLRKSLNTAYLKTSQISSFTTKWKLQAVAAAVIILFVAGGGIMFNYLQTPNTNNIALYNDYFDASNDLFTVRSAVEFSKNSSVEEGINAFNNKDFTKALSLFSETTDNMASNLYAGFSYMQLSDFKNAEQKFNHIIEDNNNLFIDQAEFNLALCFIATNKICKANDLLEVIIMKESAYSNKARDIQSNIKEQ